jgi:hypothetical protein
MGLCKAHFESKKIVSNCNLPNSTISQFLVIKLNFFRINLIIIFISWCDFLSNCCFNFWFLLTTFTIYNLSILYNWHFLNLPFSWILVKKNCYNRPFFWNFLWFFHVFTIKIFNIATLNDFLIQITHFMRGTQRQPQHELWRFLISRSSMRDMLSYFYFIFYNSKCCVHCQLL